MRPYQIATSSTADLPRTWLDAHRIPFISYGYTVNDTPFQDDCREESRAAVYAGMRNGDLLQTSMINRFEYEEFFRSLLSGGKNVIFLDMSQKMSSSYANSQEAAAQMRKEFPEQTLYVMDTRCISGGLGTLVVHMTALMEAGRSFEEVIAWGEAHKLKIAHRFTVDDLKYLKRGGRVSAATAVVGTMLNIRPILVIDPRGKLITVAKKRGEKGGVREILARFAAARDPQAPARIYSCHGDAPDTTALLIDNVRKQVPELSAAVMPLCPVIGAHTGPEMVSLIFWGDREMICREE